MLKRTLHSTLLMLGVFLLSAPFAIAEDGEKVIQGNATVEINGDKQQVSFGAKRGHTGEVKEMIKELIGTDGQIFGYGTVIGPDGVKREFNLNNIDEVLAGLPEAVRGQVERAKGMLRAQYNATGFVIGPNGKKTNITIGVKQGANDLPDEIRKMVKAHIHSSHGNISSSWRAVIIGPDGNTTEFGIGSEVGKSEFLNELPEVVRGHIKSSIDLRPTDARRMNDKLDSIDLRPTDARRMSDKLDSILRRLEQLERDIQKLKNE